MAPTSRALTAELAVLETIASQGDEARLPEIAAGLASLGYIVSARQVRSRLLNLARKGHLVHQSRGQGRGAYALTHQGKERLLVELASLNPSSSLLRKELKRPQLILPTRIEALEEGGFLAICPDLRGCHAEGNTVAEALENLEDVARVLLSLQKREGFPPPEQFEHFSSDRVLEAQLVVRSPA